MENASRALIIGAEVLIGVMILSIGAYLFIKFASYSEENYKIIEDRQIVEFNNQFLKYTGASNCTIHDIASLANLAQKNNKEYGVENKEKYSKYSEYIQVDLEGYPHLEKYGLQSENAYKNKSLIDLIKTYDLKDDNEVQYFECKNAYELNEKNKIVYIKFTIKE